MLGSAQGDASLALAAGSRSVQAAGPQQAESALEVLDFLLDAIGQSKKLTASDAGAGDELGYAVAISGDTIVVGAWLDDGAASEAGAAYVFERNEGGAGNWGQVKKLTASDAAINDNFGKAVSIDGDTLVVGAPATVNFSTYGAAYVFERNEGGAANWGEKKKLQPSDPGANDKFGSSVAVSGTTVLVGSPRNDDSGESTGAAYFFERDNGGDGNWGQIKKVTASDRAAGDWFGHSAALSGDTAIIGALLANGGPSDPFADAGAAYVFDRDLGGADNWGEVAILVASDAAADDELGVSVGISGDTAIVGSNRNDDAGTDSGSAYVFGRDEGGADNWGEVKKLTASDAAAGDELGQSVAISGDTAVVGALKNDAPGGDSGSAYVFGRAQGGADNWGESGMLAPSDIAAGDQLGRSVAISGGTAVVGSPSDDDAGGSSGSAYVFSVAPPGPATLTSPTGTIGDTTPAYTWNSVADSTWYYLWVTGPSGTVIQQWYTASAVGCAGGGACSVTPSTTLATGAHSWWVQTWSEIGTGPWSARADFTVSTGPPPAAMLVSPSGVVSDTTPTYSWNAVAESSWYYLWVDGPGGTAILQWYTAAGAGCAGGTGTCSVDPSTVLASGNHRWWVRTWNASGNGPWSARGDFAVSTGPPVAATLVSPNGALSDTTPTYTWNAVAGSTWYYLWVDGPGGEVIKQWYTASGAGCPSGTGICSVTPSTVLASGAHSWWIRTWNASGNGPWSARMDFTEQ
jgi:hypothetical protein